MKLISWNVNVIRAVHKKGFLEWFQGEQPDLLCLQARGKIRACPGPHGGEGGSQRIRRPTNAPLTLTRSRQWRGKSKDPATVACFKSQGFYDATALKANLLGRVRCLR